MNPSHAKLRSTIQVRPATLERSLFALDDLQVHSVAPQLPSKFAALVPSISNDVTNGRPERREPSQQPAASSVVRCVGGSDAVGDRKAEDVNQDVPFSPFHSFMPVETTNPAAFGRLDRLAIHDGECRLRLPTSCQASQGIQCAMQQHPDTGHTPVPEVAVHRRPRREIARKLPPLAASAEQMASKTARMSVVRGRPPDFAAGIWGATSAHCASVRSVG